MFPYSEFATNETKLGDQCHMTHGIAPRDVVETGCHCRNTQYEFEVLIFKFLIITVVIQGVDPRGLALLLPWAAKHPQENRHWQDLALIKTLRMDKTNCDSLGRVQGWQQSGVRPGGGEASSGEAGFWPSMAVQGVLQSWLICWLRCCPNSACFNIFSIHHQANLFSPNLPFSAPIAICFYFKSTAFAMYNLIIRQ